MALYDVLVWIQDNADNPARPQEGHVVDVRPHGQPWGTEEEKLFIVIPVEMAEAEAAELKKQRYKGGVDGQAIEMQIMSGQMEIYSRYAVTIGDETFVPVDKMAAYNDEMAAFNEANPMPEKVHLCSHRLPIAKLLEKKADLDITRLKDQKETYQPFLKPEAVFSTTAKEAIFYNEEKGGFRYKAGAVPLRLAEVI